MKKLVVLLLTLAILVTVGVLIVVTAQADDSLPPEEEKKGMHKEEDGPKISEDYYYLNEDEFAALTEGQQQALRELAEENRMNVGRYYRREQIILGNITEDEPRLDLETAKQIIADFESGKYSEKRVTDVFYKLFPYYDYLGGSGISRVQYILNDADADIIIFVDNDVVVYSVLGSEGKRISEELYVPPRND